MSYTLFDYFYLSNSVYASYDSTPNINLGYNKIRTFQISIPRLQNDKLNNSLTDKHTNKRPDKQTDKQPVKHTDKRTEPDQWTDTDSSTDLDSSVESSESASPSFLNFLSSISENLICHLFRKLLGFIFVCIEYMTSCVRNCVITIVTACKSGLCKIRELIGDLVSVLYSWLGKVLKVISFPFVWICKSLSSRVGLLRSKKSTEASSEHSEHSMGDVPANQPTKEHDTATSLDGQTDRQTDKQTNPKIGLVSGETQSFESEVSKKVQPVSRLRIKIKVLVQLLVRLYQIC